MVYGGCTMSQNGKGDNRRPQFVTGKEFNNNHEATFGKKQKECRTKSGCCCEDCESCEECEENEKQSDNDD